MMRMHSPAVRRAIVRLYILASVALAVLVGSWLPVVTLPRPNGFAAIEAALRGRRPARPVRRMPVYIPPGTVDPGMPRARPDSGGSERLPPPGPRSTGYVHQAR